MLVVGLTGSIGMGKSTTAEVFRRLGVPVHDSDATVHELYSGSNSQLVEDAFPGVVQNGKVNRSILGERVLGNPEALHRLENIIHPLVSDDRSAFLAAARARGRRLVILDVPLLFEIGGLLEVDVVIVTSAPASVQAERVLSRPGMTREKFENVLARQVPDSEKRKRAHFVVDTSRGVALATWQARAFLRSLAGANGL